MRINISRTVDTYGKPKLSKQLLAIARTIVFPTWRSKEAIILATHSFFLVLRTVLSLMVAKLDGRIVRDLVSVVVAPGSVSSS